MGAFRGRSRRGAAADATPLDGLLREMHELRLTLAADLNAAAGAAEAGAADVAGDIVEADQRELARFARVADLRLARLQRLAVAGSDAPRWRRRVAVALPAVPLVGALAVSAAAMTGALPLPTRADHPAPRPVAAATSSAAVTSTFQQFVSVVDSDASASQVIAAAEALHRQLARLIASTPDNPARAAEIAELLRLEQSLLIREQPPGASVVLDATRRLAARLVTAVPHLSSPTPKPTDVSKVLPTPQPSSSSTKSPSPSSTKKSTSPKPTSTSDGSGATSSPGTGQIPAVP